MEDVCRLCLEFRELQDSHLSPKALYKYVLRSSTSDGSAPVIIDFVDNTVVQRNFQPKEYLLCRECEQLFNSHGENFVNRNCYRKEGRFPLRDKLEGIQPFDVYNGKRIWTSDQRLNKINVAALEHFTCGYLWKWSIANGGPGAWGMYRGELGDFYTEQFRQFLLGEIELPRKVHIHIYVDFDEPSDPRLTPPARHAESTDGLKMTGHSFIIPGLMFTMFLGGDTRRYADKILGGSGANTTIFEWSATNSSLFRQLNSAVKEATTKGKMAKGA